jgi:transcriptional regulator with XRE-family HTH domain
MAEDFGKQFTSAREALGLSLGEAASRTKIRAEYLESIERGDFNLQLPAVYIRGFVGNYAKFLKLDVGAIMMECPIGEIRAADSLKQHASEFVESVKGEEDRSRDVPDRDKSSEARKDRIVEVLFQRLRENASRYLEKLGHLDRNRCSPFATPGSHFHSARAEGKFP